MSNDRETGVIIPFQQNAEFFYQRGNKYLTDNEDLLRAEQYLRRAYEMEPERDEYILAFAEVLHRMHRFEESLSVLDDLVIGLAAV